MNATACDLTPSTGKSCPMGAFSKTLAANAGLSLRLVLGIIFIAHGAQKAFGMFGGPGIEGFASFLGNDLGLQPAIVHAYLAAYTELIGGLLLLIGYQTRFAALAIAGTMVMAIATVHLQGGLFASDGGFEYPLTILAACITLMGVGSGQFSVDGLVKGINKEVKDTVTMD